MSLSVFANFRIDSEERLLRMKDSFESFKNANIEKWVINVRGEFNSDALHYLSERLGDKLTPSMLESKDGWFYDSRLLFDKISTSFVLLWVEDHICMCGSSSINSIVDEMASQKIDYLGYSWYGLGEFVSEFDGLPLKESENLFHLNYSKSINKIRQRNSRNLIGSNSYIVSACGIFSKRFFQKILFCGRPYIRRWPKETPFDFEKRWDDEYILPVSYAVPKYELFAAIDDDNKHKGSSLISRGLYPNRLSRDELIDIRNNTLASNKLVCVRDIFKRLPFPKWLKDYLKRISYHF